MSQAASSGYNNNRKRRKKKRSQAPVAMIYFVTMLIFLGVFGVFAKTIIEKVSNKRGDSSGLSGSYIDSYNTLYARVEKEELQDLAVIRICPEKNKIIVIPMSACTMSVPDGGKTFAEVFREGGIPKLQTAVDGTFGISSEYYATMTNDALEGVADIVGGFSYAPDEELYSLDEENDKNDISLRAGKTVLLSGRQLRLLCDTTAFSTGKQGNMEFLGEALSGIINNGFDQVEITTNSLDVIYNKIFTGSRTNLSENDYKQHRVYIRDMLSKQERPSSALIPTGDWADAEHFIVSDAFRQELYNTMEATKSDHKAA